VDSRREGGEGGKDGEDRKGKGTESVCFFIFSIEQSCNETKN
jgi:hypothetical protein